jgi:hypothetical protein
VSARSSRPCAQRPTTPQPHGARSTPHGVAILAAVGVVLRLLAAAAISRAAAVTAVVAYLCIGLTLGALATKEKK